MKVYLAGPMRGYKDFNFPLFHEATAVLRDRGYEVFSPAERELSTGLDPTSATGSFSDIPTFNLAEALVADLVYICGEADAVVMLPGWEDSQGACAEYHTARCLGKSVYYYKEIIDG